MKFINYEKINYNGEEFYYRYYEDDFNDYNKYQRKLEIKRGEIL